LYKFQRVGRRPVPILREKERAAGERRSTGSGLPLTTSSRGALIYIYIGIIQGTNEAREKDGNREKERERERERERDREAGRERQTAKERGKKEKEKKRSRFTTSEGCARSARLDKENR